MKWVCLLLGGAVLAGCSGDDSSGPPPSDGNGNPTVAVRNFAFDPASTQVPVNTTVQWVWNSAGTAHTVTFDDGPHSEAQGSGSYTRTFATAGEYHYHCAIHPQQMTGVVTVTAAATTGGQPTSPAPGSGGGGYGS